MKWIEVEDYAELSRAAAESLLDVIRQHPAAVLALPTGATPEGMYVNVVAECRRGGHCFDEVSTFNLDEYVGIAPYDPSSYSTYMRDHLFSHIDARPEHIHLPDGTAARALSEHRSLSFEQALQRECVDYEQTIHEAGGLLRTFLGLGRNGHIGFNEPGTPFESRTRVVELSESTRQANARYFSGREVPRRAITMGIGTILESRSIVLLASGSSKRAAVQRLRSGERGIDFPASSLLDHPDVTVIADRAARGDGS